MKTNMDATCNSEAAPAARSYPATPNKLMRGTLRTSYPPPKDKNIYNDCSGI